MTEHCHFYCDVCSGVFDISLPPETGLSLPKGFRAERFDIAIHGRCPACSGGKKALAGRAPEAALKFLQPGN